MPANLAPQTRLSNCLSRFAPHPGDRVDITLWSGERLRGTIADDGRVVLDATIPAPR